MKLVEGVEATGRGAGDESPAAAVVCANCCEDFTEEGGLLFRGNGQGRSGLCAGCLDEAEALLAGRDVD